MPVAVVTDSTAYLPQGLIDRYGIRVVPLYVVLAGRSGREGFDIRPHDVVQALAARGHHVSTSRPSRADLMTAYRECLDAGAEGVISIHISAELSGTWEAARLAASQVDEYRIRVIDSRSAGMGVGFPVLAAARAAAAGADLAQVSAAAQTAVELTRTLFVVDTLEHLRRGGRIGSATALLGSALAVKPVLQVHGGRVVPLEKVRTSSRAVNRLVQRAVETADDRPVAVAVHHLAAPERAERLAAEVRARLSQLRELYVCELGAAVGAHVGPGALGIVVAPSPLEAGAPAADGAPEAAGQPAADGAPEAAGQPGADGGLEAPPAR